MCGLLDAGRVLNSAERRSSLSMISTCPFLDSRRIAALIVGPSNRASSSSAISPPASWSAFNAAIDLAPLTLLNSDSGRVNTAIRILDLGPLLTLSSKRINSFLHRASSNLVICG